MAVDSLCDSEVSALSRQFGNFPQKRGWSIVQMGESTDFGNDASAPAGQVGLMGCLCCITLLSKDLR